MATYDNKSINGSGLTYFWSTIKALILGWIAPKQDHQLSGANDASKVLVTDGSKNIVTSSVTSTQLGYLGNVTSDVQTQITNMGAAKMNKGITIEGTAKSTITDISLTGDEGITLAWGDNSSSSNPDTLLHIGIALADTNEIGGVKLAQKTGSALGEYTSYQEEAIVVDSSMGIPEVRKAKSNANGVVMIFSDTTQSVAANSVTSTTERTYGIQKNSSGQLVVNVPWEEYTLPSMTSSALGGAKTNVLSTSDISKYTSTAIGIYSETLQARVADNTGAGVMKLYSAVDQTSATATDGTLTANAMTGYFAPLASPTLTGSPKATTATSSDNSTRIATTAFVQTVVQAAVSGATTFQGTINYQDSDTQHSELIQHGDFKAGEYWLVNTTGTIAGQACEAGDMVYCIESFTHTAGTAITTSKFSVVQKNLDFLTNSDIDAIIASVA